MKGAKTYQIITFYEFKVLGDAENLRNLKQSLKVLMRENFVLGTIILASEGFNSTVCGEPENIKKFVAGFEKLIDTKLHFKSSFYFEQPFRRVKVKIKPEIVTLKQTVDIQKGTGTHVRATDWNEIIADPETIILDARNNYEFQIGSFKGAINPQIKKFSELPEFVNKNFNPSEHKKVAMFCTGGIRCEKLAPFLKEAGFEEVFQLEGGILKYLEETPENESLWQGECFVFDDRIAVDEKLKKGNCADLSPKPKSKSRKT